MTKKKNVLMRSAGLLLVLVLVTSCFVGSTFAKYTTAADATESARVAKFGVTLNAGAGEMFSKTYTKTDTSFTLSENTVVSSDDSKLVAPGTNGSMAEFSMTGTPEVAVRVSYEVKTFKLTNWTTDGTDEYCPLVFTVNNTDYKIGGKYTPAGGTETDITTVAQLEEAVKTAINGYTKDYKANENLSGKTADNLQVSWAWAFEDKTAGAYQTDTKDTALGNRAAENVDQAGKIDFSVTVTVTQID